LLGRPRAPDYLLHSGLDGGGAMEVSAPDLGWFTLCIAANRFPETPVERA
jgi:hypothetical protein